MIARLIRWSITNRFLVLLASIALAVGGVVSMRATPVDALPDLSDVQVIVRTTWPGQAPQIVEDQVTYPLATTMLSVPGARVGARLFSFFGDSFVYILFDDATDLYWARSRVLEYLNTGAGAPAARARKPALGPGRHRGRLDLPVRPGRPQRPPMTSSRTAGAAGLVPANTSSRPLAGRGRGRDRRRHGAAIPGRARPGAHARATTHAHMAR